MAYFVLDKYCSAQVTGAQLQARLESSADQSGPVLAWMPGMNGWRPIGEVAAALPDSATIGSTAQQGRFQFWPIVILIMMVLWAAVTASGSFSIWDHLPSSVPYSTGFVLHLGMIGIGTLLIFLGTFYFWRRPARRAGMPMAGVAFLVALCTSVLALGTLIVTTISSGDLYRVLAAEEDMANATVFRGSEGTVYIMGSIGPSLMEDFRKAEAEGPVNKVEITSEGGLVQMALSLANHIEADALPVIVRGYCISACIHIAVASPKSYADRGAIFGFHRSAPLVEPQTDVMDFNNAQSADAAIGFLKAHGVPDAVLDIAQKHAGESIYEVTADEMVDYGAIKGIVSGTKVIRTGSKQ